MFRGAEIPTGAVVVKSNWRDNPWFTAELEQERLDCLRMQPDQYDHIWEGGYVSVVAGAYYAKSLALAKSEGRISRVPFDPLMRVKVFCDLCHVARAIHRQRDQDAGLLRSSRPASGDTYQLAALQGLHT